MSVEQLLLSQEEIVMDNLEQTAEAIAIAYELVPNEESDREEGCEILPRITAH